MDRDAPESTPAAIVCFERSGEMHFNNIKLGTGPQLHYAEKGEADGQPVLFLHGWPDSWFSFSRVLPLLPGRFRTLCIDQRGFGESERPGSGYRIEDLAADVVSFMDALEIDRASLVGHSYGSFVARCVALNNPERVDRMVLIGTGFAASNPVILELQDALRDLPDPIPVEFAREFQASTAYLPLPEEFFERIVVESLKLPARLWPVMVDRLLKYDDSGQLAKISAATLLLWGEHDALFPRTHQDGVVKAVPGAALKVYEETGHCPNWERPERVAADISTFLQVR
jgi:non-heme chloroperoxidase